MFRKWPLVKEDEEATCFKCEGSLVEADDSGFPPGEGCRKAYCESCDSYTYYDREQDL